MKCEHVKRHIFPLCANTTDIVDIHCVLANNTVMVSYLHICSRLIVLFYLGAVRSRSNTASFWTLISRDLELLAPVPILILLDFDFQGLDVAHSTNEAPRSFLTPNTDTPATDSYGCFHYPA